MDVLHRSKEQRYAFDKIYRFQSSEVVWSFFITICLDLYRDDAEIDTDSSEWVQFDLFCVWADRDGEDVYDVRKSGGLWIKVFIFIYEYYSVLAIRDIFHRI